MVQFKNFVAYAVQKIPVVCNHHQSCARALEVALQPFDSGDVQMIRGFVEHDEFRLEHNHPYQRQTFALSPGKMVGDSVFVQSHTCDVLLQPFLVVPCA